MKYSKQVRRDAKKLFRACQIEGLLNEARVRAVLQSVLQAKPKDYVPLLGCFHRLVKLDLNRRAAVIESVVPLAPAMQEQVKAHLTSRHGQGLDFQFAQVPGLIGGMRVRVGSNVYDSSIETKLSELRLQF
jgi:F-type H+-transporting ATPase subunit delta